MITTYAHSLSSLIVLSLFCLIYIFSLALTLTLLLYLSVSNSSQFHVSACCCHVYPLPPLSRLPISVGRYSLLTSYLYGYQM